MVFRYRKNNYQELLSRVRSNMIIFISNDTTREFRTSNSILRIYRIHFYMNVTRYDFNAFILKYLCTNEEVV